MALVKPLTPMLTLDDLCADMAATGRCLTRRAARDWWTKGLLPRPRRRSLGRGKGTETFWTEPGVAQRAHAAYDLLASYPRADTAILGLWLRGSTVPLGVVRAIYIRSIGHHFRSVGGRSGRPLDEVVGRLAERIARQNAKTTAAPLKARYAMADLAVEFLGVFYGLDEELVSDGLAALWESATPYRGDSASRQNGWADFHLQDDDLAPWVRYFGEMASLKAQRAAIATATDYELTRARRLVRLVFGFLDRLPRAAGSDGDFEEFGSRSLLAFGRPAVPILIAVLREGALRQKVVSALAHLHAVRRALASGKIG
jgi:hypothetical protein